MKYYYHYNLTHPDYKDHPLQVINQSPIDGYHILVNMDNVTNVKRISKTTYYKLRKQHTILEA